MDNRVKALITPSELISRYVTPYLRGLIALELHKMGLSQPRIATLLGVSQPMVAKYLKLGELYMLSKLSQAGLSREEVEVVARTVALRLLEDRVEALATLAMVELSLMTRGVLCNLYSKKTKLPEACRILKVHLELGDPFVAEVERAFKELESIRGISDIIPEVGANIVVAKPGASSHLDIVGFPGRIVRVDREVVAVGKPIYGGSKFMARLLLEIQRRWGGVRAMISLRWSKELLEALEKLGMEVCSVGPFTNINRYWVELSSYLDKCVKQPRVINDLGGPGIEPIIYILGSSALELVGIVRLVIKRLEL
jgi:predicted fused transcriptional regulator/phosphomethylpyrimidine kinase/predicted transcriptional regulator